MRERERENTRGRMRERENMTGKMGEIEYTREREREDS